MSIDNISDWTDFFYKVGEDFYDLVHGSGGDQYSDINSPYISYYGAYCVQLDVGQSRDYSMPCLGQFQIINGYKTVFHSETPCVNSNYMSSYNSGYMGDNPSVSLTDFSLDITLTSGMVDLPYALSSNSTFMKVSPSTGNYITNIFDYNYKFTSVYTSTGLQYKKTDSGSTLPTGMKYNSVSASQSSAISLIQNYNGYEYYFSGAPIYYSNGSYKPSGNLVMPSRIKEYPVIINNVNNTNVSISTDIKNTYINNGDTITTYNYTTNEGDNITINYSVDGDGLPTGYIDLNPDANVDFNFDDLFDMFNTILAPLVDVGLDLPDWDTYLPPIVTGVGGDSYINNGDIVNVDGDYYNVDFPAFTGDYPIETIAPLSSEFFVGTPPALPGLTIDNALATHTAGAVGAGFTFFDGLGLFTPFIILATVRLLVSKFRGDS